MKSVQGLLDRYGIPPPGLCVDLAIQLRDLARVDMPSGPRFASGDIRWADLELDAEGRLVPPISACSSAGISPENVALLIQDLAAWASAGDPHGAFYESNATERARRVNETRANSMTPRSQKRSKKLTGIRLEPPNEQTGEGRTGLRRAPARATDSMSSSLPDTSQLSRLRRLRIVAAGVVACVVTVASGWYYLIDSSAFNEVASGRNEKRPGVARVPVADDSFGLSAEESSSTSRLALSASADWPHPFNEASGEELSAMHSKPALLEQFDIDPSRIESPEPHRWRQDISSSDATGKEAESNETSTDADSPGSFARDKTLHLPSDEDAEVEQLDVLQELNGLAEQIPSELSSVSADSTLPAESNLVHPPLSIDLNLPQQVHRLAGQATARQPELKLRLGTSEGFVCEPLGIQTLGPGEAVGWSIQTEDAQSPVTRIFVGVQLISPRRPDLRVRVHITASDLPQLALPAKSSFLTAAERLLSDFHRRGLFQLQRLKEFSRTAGLPTHVRSSTAQRRRYLEGQVAQAERLIQIVAEAQQLRGWLAGELEVHATLFDAATNGSKPALQFGSLEDTATPASEDNR